MPQPKRTPRQKQKQYRVTVTRITVYEGRADNDDDAIERMMDGRLKEVDGETLDMKTEPIQ